MNILITLDAKFVQHTIVMLTSLFINNPKAIFRIFIATDNPKDLDILTHWLSNFNCKYEFLLIEKDRLITAKISGHVTSATYYRILAPEIIINEVEKVLYLDSDLIIRRNIQDLYDLDLSNYPIAAVRDPAGTSRKCNILDIKPGKKYFNSGVMLINLKQWKNILATEKLLTFISKEPNKLEYWDQDALNWLFANNYLEVPIEYNFQTHFAFNERGTDPRIVHYTGASKPWSFINKHPLKSEYYKYLKMTPFKNYNPPDKSVGNFFRKHHLIPQFVEVLLRKKNSKGRFFT